MLYSNKLKIMLFILFLISCTKVTTDDFSYDKIYIRLERGAFAGDSITMTQDGVVSYDVESWAKDYGNLNEPDTKSVDPSKIKELAKLIVKQGFFNLKDNYPEYSTDTSSLLIEVKIEDMYKKVYCEEYSRNCPDLMSKISSQIFKIYDKELKPVGMPG